MIRMKQSCRLASVSGAFVAGLVLLYGYATPAAAQMAPTFASYAAPAAPQSVADTDDALPPELRRQVVADPTGEPAGTIVVDTPHNFLYLTLGGGRALRYAIGAGRQGFTWSGTEAITRKAEWPDWIPPVEMVDRQPYLPRFMAGGPGNPLGARALYLGNTDYRIHGTNDPSSIGKHMSSGCIRLLNADIIDLYSRVGIGTKVVVIATTQGVAALEHGRHAVLADRRDGTTVPVAARSGTARDIPDRIGIY